MGTALNKHKVNDFPFHWIEKRLSLPHGEMKENALHFLSIFLKKNVFGDASKMESHYIYFFLQRKRSQSFCMKDS